MEGHSVARPMRIPSWISTEAEAESHRGDFKAIVRCAVCRLVQYETRSGCCRRCDQQLPVMRRVPEGAAEHAASSNQDSMTTDYADSRRPSRRVWSAGLRRVIAQRTREGRMELGISQVKFARMLDIPRSYLSRVENGHLLPGPAMLERLAEHLGIAFCSLWVGADSSSPAPKDQAAQILIHAGNLNEKELAELVFRARWLAAENQPRPASRLRQVA